MDTNADFVPALVDTDRYTDADGLDVRENLPTEDDSSEKKVPLTIITGKILSEPGVDPLSIG